MNDNDSLNNAYYVGVRDGRDMERKLIISQKWRTMSGKIIYEPHRPTACKRGMCEGKPKPESYSDGTIWQCDECGSRWEKCSGAQYNEPFDSWRQKGGEYESAPEFADWREAMHGFRRWLTEYTRVKQAEAWERGHAALEQAWKSERLYPHNYLPVNPYREETE